MKRTITNITLWTLTISIWKDNGHNLFECLLLRRLGSKVCFGQAVQLAGKSHPWYAIGKKKVECTGMHPHLFFASAEKQKVDKVYLFIQGPGTS